MAAKVTLSLDPETLARARAAAQHYGMSLSAWIDRAARREALRDAARRQEEWLAANPDVRAELDGFDRLADKLESGWSDLAEAA
jgi:post-segregation antitoxin (ccd killing protein)